ncbi:hypothetical protein HID58_079679, partial [Brassica napus]
PSVFCVQSLGFNNFYVKSLLFFLEDSIFIIGSFLGSIPWYIDVFIIICDRMGSILERNHDT